MLGADDVTTAFTSDHIAPVAAAYAGLSTSSLPASSAAMSHPKLSAGPPSPVHLKERSWLKRVMQTVLPPGLRLEVA